MPTPKQLAANRANAKKSTVSRFNALKFGITAQSILLPGESLDDLTALAASYHDRFQPEAPEHRFLVKSLFTADWFADRLYRAETHVWDRSGRSDFDHAIIPLWEMAGAFMYDFYPKLRRAHAAPQRTYLASLRELRAQGLQPREESTGQPAPPTPLNPDLAPFCEIPSPQPLPQVALPHDRHMM